MKLRQSDFPKNPATSWLIRTLNVYHSHGGIGRLTYQQRIGKWEKICALIDQKKRPSKP